MTIEGDTCQEVLTTPQESAVTDGSAETKTRNRVHRAYTLWPEVVEYHPHVPGGSASAAAIGGKKHPRRRGKNTKGKGVVEVEPEELFLAPRLPVPRGSLYAPRVPRCARIVAEGNSWLCTRPGRTPR